jgi:O-antigen/teichoic acid export membrane protein
MIEKIKELTKDTIIYGISTIVGRFLNFLLVPIYTNYISTSDFGVFANIYAYIAILTILFIYGMDAAFLKYSSLADESKKKDSFSTPFIFVFLTTILIVLLLFILKIPFLDLMKVPSEYSYLYLYFILILAFDATALIPFASLRLKRKAARFTSIKLINIFINLSLNLILIVGYNYGIEAIFISNLAASGFSLLALLPEIISNLKINVDPELLKKMLWFGIPYLPASIAAMLVQVIDRPIVLALTDASTLGVYQANYKLGIFMMLFVSMFQYAWQPFFLTNAKEKNAKDIFSKILTLFLLSATFIWIVLTLFVEDLAKFEFLPGKTIIGQEYLSGLIIVPIILLGYLFHGLYVNFTAGIYIEEKTKYFPIVTGSGAVINTAVNFLLIPFIGLIGAALATLVSYMVMSGGLFYVSQKFYETKYEYKKIGKILFLILVSASFYYYLIYTIEFIFIYKILFLFGFIFLMFLLKILKMEEFVSLTRLLFGRKNYYSNGLSKN